MSKKNAKSTETATARRGRPEKPLTLPRAQKFTVGDVLAINKETPGGIRCRLTVYTRLGKLVEAGTLAIADEKRPTGGVGKPANIFMRVAANAPKAKAKAKAKSPKAKAIATAPVVDLTPAPAPVAETPADPVTA